MLGATLIEKDDMIKVCRLIGRRFYCIEFTKDVKAIELVAYWELDDNTFKSLGRPTEIPNDGGKY